MSAVIRTCHSPIRDLVSISDITCLASNTVTMVLSHWSLKTEFLNNLLTHRGRNKMAEILQMTFKCIFPEWKLLNCRYNFIIICSLGSNWQSVSNNTYIDLVPFKRQAIIGTNVDIVHRRIYASPGLDELIVSRQFQEKYQLQCVTYDLTYCWQMMLAMFLAYFYQYIFIINNQFSWRVGLPGLRVLSNETNCFPWTKRCSWHFIW